MYLNDSASQSAVSTRQVLALSTCWQRHVALEGGRVVSGSGLWRHEFAPRIALNKLLRKKHETPWWQKDVGHIYN